MSYGPSVSLQIKQKLQMYSRFVLQCAAPPIFVESKQGEPKSSNYQPFLAPATIAYSSNRHMAECCGPHNVELFP